MRDREELRGGNGTKSEFNRTEDPVCPLLDTESSLRGVSSHTRTQLIQTLGDQPHVNSFWVMLHWLDFVHTSEVIITLINVHISSL